MHLLYMYVVVKLVCKLFSLSVFYSLIFSHIYFFLFRGEATLSVRPSVSMHVRMSNMTLGSPSAYYSFRSTCSSPSPFCPGVLFTIQVRW